MTPAFGFIKLSAISTEMMFNTEVLSFQYVSGNNFSMGAAGHRVTLKKSHSVVVQSMDSEVK